MAEAKNTRAGRRKRDPLTMLAGHQRGVDGTPIHPHKPVGDPASPSYDAKLADQQLFIMERTRELWIELCKQRPSEDEYDLHALAMERAGEELTKRLRSGKKLFPYTRQLGRPIGSGVGKADDETLLREYNFVRKGMRACGPQYAAVARQLWRRRWHYSFTSVDALRMRLVRAVKKSEHK